MKNAIIKCLSCCMMVVMILFLMTAQIVSACASGRKTDSVTGWTFSSPSTYTHAGTKSLTYYYGNAYGESYHTRFTEGKNLWGTNINLQRSTNSDTANVIFRVDLTGGAKYPNANAVTESRVSGTLSLHQKSWTIIFFKDKVDPMTNYQRKTIAAHEIGHAYGLGEVWNISQVMYGATPSTSTKVTTSDLKGLKLMTHVHSCQDATTYNTYGWVDGTFHRKRCNTCSSFIYEVHTNGSSCTLCG